MKRPVRAPARPAAIEPRPRRGARKPGRPSREHREPYDIESITDAAVRVFNRRGYEAASMEDVARETGLRKSSLYYHVSGKEELLARALERAFNRLLGILEEPGSRSGSPLARLRHIVYRGVLITLEFVQEVELLQRIKGNTPTERQAMARRRRFDREVAALVAEAVAAGELRADIEPGLMTRLIFGMSNSITQWYRREGRLRPEQIAEAVLSLVFEGITRRSA
ncbi:MAG TPA: TetR/AcrR family transcriptional regulator [Candidatus Binataceae bacterium]|jgi:AcrR family transcriptional regulator|nr:TetR/AcrR family transcriptional regulator [Candidatus Binataceae bacterium]